MLGGGVVRAVRLRRRSATRRAGCADCRPHCGSDAAANGHADGNLYAYSRRNAYADGAPYPYARADRNADADGNLYSCPYRNAYADSDPYTYTHSYRPRTRPFALGGGYPMDSPYSRSESR